MEQNLNILYIYKIYIYYKLIKKSNSNEYQRHTAINRGKEYLETTQQSTSRRQRRSNKSVALFRGRKIGITTDCLFKLQQNGHNNALPSITGEKWAYQRIAFYNYSKMGITTDCFI